MKIQWKQEFSFVCSKSIYLHRFLPPYVACFKLFNIIFC